MRLKWLVGIRFAVAPFPTPFQYRKVNKSMMDSNRVGLGSQVYVPGLSRRLIFAVVLVIAVAAIGIGIRNLPDLNWIAEREDAFRNGIAMAPITSFIGGLIVYVLLSLIPGTYGKSIVFGWLFGFVSALFIVEFGLTAAAVLSYLVGRFLVKHFLYGRWQIYLQRIRERFAQNGAFYLLWLRMAHAPFTLVNYGAGAVNIPLSTFWWTTHVGILPATLVFTFAGSRVPSIRDVVEHGVWAIVDPALLVVLAIIAFLPIFMHPWLSRNQD